MGKRFDDLRGKAEEAYGKATGDRSAEAEGKVDQAKAKVEHAVDEAGKKAKKAAQSATEKIKDAFEH